MKYFTADLIQRCNSLDDAVADAASVEWDRAIVRSRRRWKQIQASFPKAVQRFKDDHICLHDARVLSIGRHGESFIFVLEPEPPAETMVILTFTLSGEPVLNPQGVPAYVMEGDYAEWAYEEWDLDRQKHCWFEVLLSNGWSVRLPFRDFHYLIAQRLFPVPKALAAAATAPPAVPQSA